jgi:hypothetical protein
VHDTALVVAVIYFILALIFVPIFYLVTRGQAAMPFSPIVMVIAPICYGIFGYIFSAIGCWVYNLVASWTGGIALTLESSEPAA